MNVQGNPDGTYNVTITSADGSNYQTISNADISSVQSLVNNSSTFEDDGSDFGTAPTASVAPKTTATASPTIGPTISITDSLGNIHTSATVTNSSRCCNWYNCRRYKVHTRQQHYKYRR